MNKYSEAIKADIMNAVNTLHSCIQLGVIEDIDIPDGFPTIKLKKAMFEDFTKDMVVHKDEKYPSKYYDRFFVITNDAEFFCLKDKPEETNE